MARVFAISAGLFGIFALGKVFILTIGIIFTVFRCFVLPTAIITAGYHCFRHFFKKNEKRAKVSGN